MNHSSFAIVHFFNYFPGKGSVDRVLIDYHHKTQWTMPGDGWRTQLQTASHLVHHNLQKKTTDRKKGGSKK